MAELNQFDYANIFSTYTDESGTEFFNLFNSVKIDGEIDGSLYTIETIHSPNDWYITSYNVYGTTRLWWILLIANEVTNPFDVIPGKQIKVLKREVVSEILSQINNS